MCIMFQTYGRVNVIYRIETRDRVKKCNLFCFMNTSLFCELLCILYFRARLHFHGVNLDSSFRSMYLWIDLPFLLRKSAGIKHSENHLGLRYFFEIVPSVFLILFKTFRNRITALVKTCSHGAFLQFLIVYYTVYYSKFLHLYFSVIHRWLFIFPK